MKCLNLGLQNSTIHRAYREFASMCLTPQAETRLAKKQFKNVQNLFIREHQLEDFCDMTFELSEQLKKQGNMPLSSLFVSELGKTCKDFQLYERAEALFNIAIENCQKSKDGLHELARLIDLENMYSFLNYRRGLFDVLNRKKECCKRVIDNYDENAANFASITMKPTSKQSVKMQLAFTYSNIARMIERKKPENAITLYTKAKNIFDELGRSKESAYYEKRIQIISSYMG